MYGGDRRGDAAVFAISTVRNMNCGIIRKIKHDLVAICNMRLALKEAIKEAGIPRERSGAKFTSFSNANMEHARTKYSAGKGRRNE